MSFPHNLYDFSYNLMPRLGIELTSESCTSLNALNSGSNTDWATATAAIKSNSYENKFAQKSLSGLGCLSLYRWQQLNKCRILKQKCLKTLVLKYLRNLSERERERERDRNSPPPREQISDKKGSKYFLKKFCRWLLFHHPLLRSCAIHLVLFTTFFQLVLSRSFNQQFSLRTQNLKI